MSVIHPMVVLNRLVGLFDILGDRFFARVPSRPSTKLKGTHQKQDKRQDDKDEGRITFRLFEFPAQQVSNALQMFPAKSSLFR